MSGGRDGLYQVSEGGEKHRVGCTRLEGVGYFLAGRKGSVPNGLEEVRCTGGMGWSVPSVCGGGGHGLGQVSKYLGVERWAGKGVPNGSEGGEMLCLWD